MRYFIIILLLFCIAGCVSLGFWTQVKEGEYRDTARDFSVVVPAGWMRFNLARYFIMTKDGTVLDNIAVERHKIDKKLEFTKKEFFKDMTPQDLAEIEIDNFKSSAVIGKFEIIQNKPVTIDNQQACRIEYTYVAKGGLKIHGIYYGFLRKDWVYRIHYEAADQHYFNKYLHDFDRFIESFHLI